MTTVTIAVPEIHCDHCKNSIEGAVAPLGGVQQAVVDVPARSVTVTYDADTIDRGALVRAIEDLGYQVPTGQ
jgi:copper chaperone